MREGHTRRMEKESPKLQKFPEFLICLRDTVDLVEDEGMPDHGEMLPDLVPLSALDRDVHEAHGADSFFHSVMTFRGNLPFAAPRGQPKANHAFRLL